MNASNDRKKLKLQTQVGFFAFSLASLLSSTTEGLPIFLQERKFLRRETSRGAYRFYFLCHIKHPGVPSFPIDRDSSLDHSSVLASRT